MLHYPPKKEPRLCLLFVLQGTKESPWLSLLTWTLPGEKKSLAMML